MIDPRDDESLVDAMRSLLTDDGMLRQLQDAIAERPRRTWADYARDLWSQLVVPELEGANDG